MCFKAVAFFVFLCSILQGSYCLSRDEVIAEYQPILWEHAANLTTEHATIATEVSVVENQLKNDTLITINLMTTQITTLKSTITAAKASAVNKTEVLNCIKPQETAANAISVVPLNATCWVNADFEDLGASGKNFALLAAVPNATIPACTSLNPLIPNQDDLFLDCITDKILDFGGQLTALRSDFVNAKDSTLKNGIQCLADQSAIIAQQINEINFQVTLCLTMG